MIQLVGHGHPDDLNSTCDILNITEDQMGTIIEALRTYHNSMMSMMTMDKEDRMKLLEVAVNTGIDNIGDDSLEEADRKIMSQEKLMMMHYRNSGDILACIKQPNS